MRLSVYIFWKRMISIAPSVEVANLYIPPSPPNHAFNWLAWLPCMSGRENKGPGDAPRITDHHYAGTLTPPDQRDAWHGGTLKVVQHDIIVSFCYIVNAWKDGWPLLAPSIISLLTKKSPVGSATRTSLWKNAMPDNVDQTIAGARPASSRWAMNKQMIDTETTFGHRLTIMICRSKRMLIPRRVGVNNRHNAHIVAHE